MATENRLSILRKELARKREALEAKLAQEIAKIDEELSDSVEEQELPQTARRPKLPKVEMHKPRRSGTSGLTPTQAIKKLVNENPRYAWGIRELRDKLIHDGVRTMATTEKKLYQSIATVMKRLTLAGFVKMMNTPKGQRYIKSEEGNVDENGQAASTT